MLPSKRYCWGVGLNRFDVFYRAPINICLAVSVKVNLKKFLLRLKGSEIDGLSTVKDA